VPIREQPRIRAAIDALEEFPNAGDIRKMQGGAEEWRLRVGDWRVRFALGRETRTIVVLRVLPRDKAYRD